MQFESETRVALSADRVWDAVRDLSTYPDWFTIVDRARSLPDDAWLVELAARLGPLKRAKRVRMVRVVDDVEARHVRFERDEQDGQRHSAWALDASITDTDAVSCLVHVRLHYGGVAWLPGVDLLLRHEARHAGQRLEAAAERRN